MSTYRRRIWRVELSLWLAIAGLAGIRVVVSTALGVLELAAPVARRLAQRVAALSAQVDQLMYATPEATSTPAEPNSSGVIDGEVVAVHVIWEDAA
jgi:hypothetical protein